MTKVFSCAFSLCVPNGWRTKIYFENFFFIIGRCQKFHFFDTTSKG
jgi:hypothetical protein